MTKKALITGITGQDGAYLSRFLLDKGYEVYGLLARRSSPTTWRLQYLNVLDKVKLIDGDLTDIASIIRALNVSKPDEVYNLGAQSFVATSWEQPLLTADATGLGALHILEALRQVRPEARFYQASTSEMFGKIQEPMQSEKTPFYPRSPYGVSKLFAHWMTINYRESYDIFGCSGILFNHESPLRGIEFVTRKITDAFAKISLGQQEYVELGNLDAKRDWGYAPEYVQAMWLMLQNPAGPRDYVIATGKLHSVRQLLQVAFAAADLEYEQYVKVNEGYFRPGETVPLVGNAARIKADLGWQPQISFEAVIQAMVEQELKLLQTGR